MKASDMEEKLTVYVVEVSHDGNHPNIHVFSTVRKAYDFATEELKFPFASVKVWSHIPDVVDSGKLRYHGDNNKPTNSKTFGKLLMYHGG